ncbi:MAG: AAA family ATPase [Acidobacteriota bacterium]
MDICNQLLLRGSQELALRPKTFEVLRCLVQHAGQLVTKAFLLDAVWSDRYVDDTVLKVSIREIRKVLDDDPKAPRFIETLHRRGYRLIGPITEADTSGDRVAVTGAQIPETLAGRQMELSRLHACCEKVLRGDHQAVFISGEQGIGKTALVEHFLVRAARVTEVCMAYGQCQELQGKAEAFRPMLEVLTEIGQRSGNERLIRHLERYAPTWLAQMPSLLEPADYEALRRSPTGWRPERMLREIGAALAAFSAETPLILVLEDLHWSDHSTIDLVSALAARRGQARLMLIATYRYPPEPTNRHLKTAHQLLRNRNQCVDLPLQGLSWAAVQGHLEETLPGGETATDLAERCHKITGGNPLFLVTMVEDLLNRGTLTQEGSQWQLASGAEEATLGSNLGQVVEAQLEALSSEDQRLLEVASVAGVKFSALVVATAIEQDVVEIEEHYEALARRQQFLRSSRREAGRERRRAARYQFTHSLYQKVLYLRLAAAKRIQLHRRIGEALEVSYGNKAAEFAAELAVHLERGETAAV